MNCPQSSGSLASIFSAFSAFLHSPQFLQSARLDPLWRAFSRTRKLPLPVLVAFLMELPRSGLQSELLAFFDHALAATCVSKSALCQARSQLNPAALGALLSQQDAFANTHLPLPASMRWHGFRVLAIDSTVLRVPDVPECADWFGGMTTSCGSFRPLARASALWDVARQCVVDVTIGRYNSAERSLAQTHLRCVRNDDLLVMDRGYPSAQWLQALQERGVRYCVRMCGLNWQLVRAFARSGKMDQCLSYDKVDGKALAMRLIRHCLPNGKEIVLATNVLDRSITPSQFAQLYHQRWSIEEGFKQFKARMQVENFSGILPHAVLQDIYAAMLRNNCAQWLQLAAKLEARVNEKPDKTGQTHYGTWQHKPNRSLLSKMLKHHLPSILLGLQDWHDQLVRMYQRIGQAMLTVVTKVARTCPRKPRKVRIAGFHPGYKSA